MDDITRRSFFKHAGAAAAVAGAVAVAPGSIATAVAATTPATDRELTAEEHLAAGEHLVAHLKNAETGEITLFVGHREVTFHDRTVAARLIRATR
jgi:hypothetical protein